MNSLISNTSFDMDSISKKAYKKIEKEPAYMQSRISEEELIEMYKNIDFSTESTNREKILDALKAKLMNISFKGKNID